MNKSWDKNKGGRSAWTAWLAERLAEAMRVAKPGARMLCWALPRTSHWTGCAVEDAGWIIENKCYHLFGSGFPKGKSQLKPAAEEWVLARKPGKGVPDLNVDACRIEGAVDQYNVAGPGDVGSGGIYNRGWVGGGVVAGVPHPESPRHDARGRWPANVALSHVGGPDGCREVGTKRVKTGIAVNRNRNADDLNSWYGTRKSQAGEDITYADADGLETVAAWECVEGCAVAQLDRQSGTLKSAGPKKTHSNSGLYKMGSSGAPGTMYGDSGGASRFFYCAKASRRDRGEGNTHPTVKSTPLMRWLIRLISDPGDVILDPFMGSGSTGKACVLEGRSFVGAGSDPVSFATAERRIAAARASCTLFA